METAAIGYRVADFLKKHPPFHAIDEASLVKLVARGRVRFHEANDFILWQGEPHRAHIFVIQQGTVSLWDERAGRAELRDMLGAGDMLGLERFHGSPCCAYSARAGSDVVLYTFPAEDFAALLDGYPAARQYLAVHGGVTVGYQPAEARGEPHDLFLHDLVKGRELSACTESESVGAVAGRMLASGADAIAVLDGEHRVRSILVPRDLLAWIARGAGDVNQPIALLPQNLPTAAALDTAVADGVLAMAGAHGGALAITADGTASGRVHALVTARDLAPAFGEQPQAILEDIGVARGVDALRSLNLRARAFVFHHLKGAAPVDWLTRFAHAVDARIVRKVIELTGPDLAGAACWCFAGPAGRAESLTAAAPWLIVVLSDAGELGEARTASQRVVEALDVCGYLSAPEQPFDRSFCVATASEWKARFTAWVRDPTTLHHLHMARPLFDLRAFHGDEALWQAVTAGVAEVIDRDFLHILANDCLANLPPLTFFQDAVVEKSGDFESVFRLEESVLGPLVDVGRVFGLAGGAALGRSTLQRLATARDLFPAHESIFRHAIDALRVVLWQQGRVGISQGTDGSQLPPTLLSRQDRQMLKGGFRPILQLLEFTAERAWIRDL